LLLEVILPVLADPDITDEEVGGLLRERIGMKTLGRYQRPGGRACRGITDGCLR
jgi:hypothetical protein